MPVNLAWAIGRSVVRLLNDIQRLAPEEGRLAEADEVAGRMARQTAA